MPRNAAVDRNFQPLPEPRNGRNLKYPLLGVVALALYGILCGFIDFANIAYYCKQREEELTEEFGLAAGVASHDVFSDVFRLLDVGCFMECFARWVSEAFGELAGGHVAIDGKAIRAAAETGVRGRSPTCSRPTSAGSA